MCPKDSCTVKGSELKCLSATGGCGDLRNCTFLEEANHWVPWKNIFYLWPLDFFPSQLLGSKEVSRLSL